MKNIIFGLFILLGLGLTSSGQSEKIQIELSPLVGMEVSSEELRQFRIDHLFHIKDFEYLTFHFHENRYLVQIHYHDGSKKEYNYPSEKVEILKSRIKINNYLNEIFKRTWPQKEATDSIEI